ncbi:hypothetical protein [Aureispira sp. CCB-QB1]|uniref:hypothetical protein n=1 Tax=Aureispira sp. CCB-QB1 TaxID=1313421 RepID=UPI00069784F1|nr:hypothetical protein [Aureispira sp. CCB-QB1]
MKINKTDQKKIALGIGALVIILMVVFVFGKQQGRNENEQREIDVQVNIKDEQGHTVAYNPNELLKRLNKGLTTTFFFNSTAKKERCEAIEDLYQLDATRFMATIKAYQEKYNVSIITHMKACYFTCYSDNGSLYNLVEQRFNHLKNLIH